MASLSPLAILQETGYSEHHTLITEEAIAKELQAHPSLIGDWYIWSENKRCSPAWFITKNQQGQWLVGLCEKSGQRSQTRTFADALSATAFFVKREMEQLRQ
jgi:hypothetical protein